MRDDIKIPWREQIVWLLIFMVLFFTVKHFFFPIDDNEAIDAIVGEASNQSYDTMVCVGQGIRHRGTLKGVYGLHAKHNSRESEDTWRLAETAWEDSSMVKDQINGAKNWGNLDDIDKLHVYFKDIKAECGDILFY